MLKKNIFYALLITFFLATSRASIHESGKNEDDPKEELPPNGKQEGEDLAPSTSQWPRYVPELLGSGLFLGGVAALYKGTRRKKAFLSKGSKKKIEKGKNGALGSKKMRQLVDACHRKNQKKLFNINFHQKKVGPIKLNQKAAKAWIDAMKKEGLTLSKRKKKALGWCVRSNWGDDLSEAVKKDKNTNWAEIFAQKYIESLRVISWAAFKARIEAMGRDIMALIEEKKCRDIYFFLPGSIQEANTWFFFLIWGEIGEKIGDHIACHFFSSKGADDYKNNLHGENQWIEEALQIAEHREKLAKKESLILFFGGTAYGGESIRKNVRFFEKNLNLAQQKVFVVVPYASHKAYRFIMGMDGEGLQQEDTRCTPTYLKGGAKDIWGEKREDAFLKTSPIQWLPSTLGEKGKELIQEIVLGEELWWFMGSHAPLTIPLVVPYEMANKSAILTDFIAFGCTPKMQYSQGEYNAFLPRGLVGKIKKKAHSAVKKAIFIQKKGKKRSNPIYIKKNALLPYAEDLLPIQTLYKGISYISPKGARWFNGEANKTPKGAKNQGNFSLFYLLWVEDEALKK